MVAIAVSAGDSLIIPMKQDQMSKFAMESMMSLIYGPCPLKVSFSSQAEDVRLALPKIFMAITNQTDYGQSHGLVAAMDHSAVVSLKKVHSAAPDRFFHAGVKCGDFASTYVAEVGDLKELGVVGTAHGIPVCSIKAGELRLFDGGIQLKHDSGVVASAMYQLLEIVNRL